MRRRDFIRGIVGSTAAWPIAARAEQPERQRRVGFLRAEKPPAPWMGAFQKALRELGYEEGKNLLFEYRWAGGDDERLPELANDLVRLNVEVIVVSGTPAILALKKATTTIPIVMAAAGDPVGTGIVKSLAYPGGNITGMSNMIPDVGGKRLQLLKQFAPTAVHIGIIWNANNPFTQEVNEQTCLFMCIHFAGAYLPPVCLVWTPSAPLCLCCRRVMRDQVRLRSSRTVMCSVPQPSQVNSILSPSMNGLSPR
jgi:putative ABC transport system substrate-binding protein